MSNSAQTQESPFVNQETLPDSSSSKQSKWSTRQLVTMALMCAIAILLSFIEFAIFPVVSFLKLDISLVPSAVTGFAYGPGPGIIVGIVAALGHAALTGNWVGALMNCIVTLAFVAPSAALYKRFHSFRGALVSLAIGTVVMIVAAAVANILIDPPLYGIPLDVILGFLPWIVAFNVIKALVISLLTELIYKRISNLVTPEKKQIKGRI